jgi:uncharacterized protein (DUF58 family)
LSCRDEIERMSLRRNALVLSAILCVLAIAGAWSAHLERVWLVPAAVLLVGLAAEATAVARCTVLCRPLLPGRWPLGRSREVRFALRQDSRGELPVQVLVDAPEVFAAEPRVQAMRLVRGLEHHAILRAAARRLGSYAWPAPTMRIAGPLGLAWWPRRVPAEGIVTVVPDLDERAERAAGSARGGEQRGSGPGAGSEILELRDYRHGDPLRRIDWKASARRRRLVSRETSEDQHLEVIVAIDAGRASGLGAGETDRLGLYVNVAARLAQRAVMLDDAVGVLVFASRPLARLHPARGAAAVTRVRSLLAACRVQPAESNPVLAAAAVRAMALRRSLVVILSDFEDCAAGEQLLAAVRLLTPKHFAFIAGFESARVEAFARDTVAEPLGAYRALAAVEYASAVSANVRGLRSLGAAAITARPEHLDRAVFAGYRQLRARRMV